VSIDSLKQSQHNLDVRCKDVELTRQRAPQGWAANSAESKHHDFNGGSVFGSKTKRSTILMVDLMNHLVQARSMQSSVRPVMPGIFEDEEYSNLVWYCED
jgi:hypothetical protein